MKLELIQKVYHNQKNDVIALENINIRLIEDGITMIVGPSGCGKTTLLNILSGLDQSFEGDLFSDESVETINQEPDFIDYLSVIQNLQLVSSNAVEIKKLLEYYDLKDQGKQSVHMLSSGQLKRLQIIRAMLTDPDILLCDEPTASLDEENKKYIMDHLKKISKDKIVIVVTHESNLIDEYADNLIEMDDGKIVRIKKIRQNDQHEILNLKKVNISSYLGNYIMLLKNWKNLIITFLGLLLVLSIYSYLEINQNIQSEMTNQINWYASSNLLESIPYDEFIDFQNDECNEFHLWTNEEVQQMISDHPEIIGYYRSNESLYNVFGSDEIFEQFTSNMVFRLIGMNGETFDEKAQANRGIIIYEGIPAKDPQLYDYIYNGNISKELKELFAPYWYTVQHPMAAEVPMVYSDYQGLEYSVYAFSKPTYIYSMTGIDSFEVALGEFPVNQDEILISKQLADYLVSFWKLSGLNEVLGKTLDIYYISGNDAWTSNPDTYKLIITGITLQGNLNERQIFMSESNYDNMYQETFGYDQKNVPFPCVTLMIDPNCNKEKLIEELNQEYGYTNAYFRDKTYVALGDIYEDVEETSEFSFALLTNITLLIIGLIILILIFYSFIIRKKLLTHNTILKRYEYSILLKSAVTWSINTIVIMLFVTIFMPAIVDYLNKGIIEYVYGEVLTSTIINYNIYIALISGILTGMILGLCEVIQNVEIRKH